MTTPTPPIVEPRRKKEFAAELLLRARAWIPAWELDPASRDFGMALLDIAARFNSEVAERLDRMGEKNTRGLLDWLGIQGQAARAARMPVVLRLTENRLDPVLARAPVKLRADSAAGPIVFETETDVTLVPGRLAALVAVSPADDAFYLPAPGIDNVEPAPPQPNTWRTRAFAEKGGARLQLDPQIGLAPEMLLQLGRFQYRVIAVDKDLVTLAPALDEDVDAGSAVTRVASFAPFDQDVARNRQLHALYIGDSALLDIKAAATIELAGLAGVPAGAQWQYWGKLGEDSELGWQALEASPAKPLSLNKPQGSVEPREVGGVESRWLRAVAPHHSGAAVSFDRLELLINPGVAPDSCPFAPNAGATPAIEGVANATPQVLDGVFYPFGREPRVLDTFYLGCAEAFSKKQARVTMCFDLADPSMKSLTLVPRPDTSPQVLAAAAQDGSLHLLKFERGAGGNGAPTLKPLREPVQPPTPKDGGERSVQGPIQLDRTEKNTDAARPAAWIVGDDFYVAVAAGAKVWVWHQKSDPLSESGWIDFGVPGPDLADTVRIIDLALVSANNALFVLRGARLYWRGLDAQGQWKEAKLGDDPIPPEALAVLAPVKVETTVKPLLCSTGSDGLARLILLKADNSVLAVTVVPDLVDLLPAIRPLALLDETPGNTFRLRVVAVGADAKTLQAFVSKPFEISATPQLEAQSATVSLDVGAMIVGRDLEAGHLQDQITIGVATAKALKLLTPFSAGQEGIIVSLEIGAEDGVAGGAAVFVGSFHVVIPGIRSDALAGALTFPGKLRVTLTRGNFADALLTPGNSPVQEGDTYAFTTTGSVELAVIGAPVGSVPNIAIHLFRDPLDKLPDGQRSGVYRIDVDNSREGIRIEGERDRLDIDTADIAQSLLIVTGTRKLVYTINRIVGEPEPGDPGRSIVTLERNLPSGTDPVQFWPQLDDAELGALLEFEGNESQAWTNGLLATHPIFFPGLLPSPQHAQPVNIIRTNGRTLLLDTTWSVRPGATAIAAYIAPNSSVTWHRQLGETANNPELSWEYWNGSGWWKLPLERDDTANFQRGGMLRLKVPSDLQATEWAGKTNFWIRARLVGGDYGREIVTALSTPTSAGQAQTIQRDTSRIHAPTVLQLNLRYSVPAATPAHLLTEDSATISDQSAANRSNGAVVEAFVPLGVMLERLDADNTQARAAANCTCSSAATTTTTQTPAAASAVGQALYLGFDARLQGEQINLLFLPSTQRNFDSLAPARIDVLRGTRFEPVVAGDATRALGEAGIVSLTLSRAPEPAELFGKTLAWLRIRPGAGDTDWTPALRGVYLNAVWAQAAETQEFEMLGSSEGAPFQQVLLARPPLLRDTLELRVREPLGEEERAVLLQGGADQVRSDVTGQPGDWVLWRQVVDPADEAAQARVYALDEARGVIRFGDGVHGAIPPIGRDAIMAFRYRRTDAVSADAIAAGSTLAIVTPVESAEAAFAADLAAGGSPPEDVARVLRFSPSHLRQRGVAVTARDLEDMALILLPEAAQARCLKRGAATQMVLVMRGADPLPARAVKRELRRQLLAASAPALAAPGAFSVVDPVPVPFYVQLVLATSSLDHGAVLAADAKRALAALFDSAGGGPDGDGWRLGARPNEIEIAASLLDVAFLDAVASVILSERDSGQRDLPLRTALRADELAVLAADGIELQFIVPQEVS